MNAFSLRIRLFGPFELTSGDEKAQPGPGRDQTADDVLPALPCASKARSLLAYLIVNHDHALARETLAGLFWPERANQRARRALSHALWQIRRALGPASDRVVTEHDTVTFAFQPGDRLDVEAFEEAVRTSPQGSHTTESDMYNLEEAVALHRADFLVGCYDDWALVERERLRELYLRALERLITLHKQRGDYKSALTYSQRLVACDPLHELAHRELMRLYYLLNRPRAALEQFTALHELLDEELGVEPSAATMALHHEIVASMKETELAHLPLRSSPPPLLRDVAHLPFVGRTEERTALVDALQAALQGHSGLVLVEGDAGVGKTRLVQEAIATARWRGFQVAVGKADPLAAPSPYQLLSDALSPLLTPLRLDQLAQIIEPQWLSAAAQLLPSIPKQLPDLASPPSLEPQEEQQRLWEGLSRSLIGMASVAPLLLVLEDLHWADEAILSALPHLASSLLGSRALIIFTCRPAEARQRDIVWETLDTLDRAQPLLHIHLASFQLSEAVALVRRALGVGNADTQARTFARRLQNEIGNNPLFLVETLKSLLERGDLAPMSGSASSGYPSHPGWRFPNEKLPLSMPTSVQALIGERLARLPSELRNPLDLVAVLGEDADFPVLCQASDIPPAELSEQLSKLEQRGFLKETKTGHRFEHDLVRSTVYDNIEQGQRRELHRRVGEALEAVCPDQIEKLAQHFDLGGVTEKAATYAMKAAGRAQSLHDFETAIGHYRKALRSPVDAATRWEILASLEKALGVLGRRDDQKAILDEMLVLAKKLRDPLLQAQTRHSQGWLEVLAGDPERALKLLDEATRLARIANSKDLLGNCLVSAARAWWNTGNTPRCQAATEEARSLFEETENQDGLSRTLNMLGNIHLGHTGHFGEALACFEADRRICRDLGDRYREACALGNVGITYHVLGSYQRSQEALAKAWEVIERVGDRLWQGIIRLWQASNQYESGHPEEARQRAEEALRLCQEVGNRNFEIETWGLLGLIALDWGDYEQAHSHFRKAVEEAEAAQYVGDRTYHLSHLALASLHLGDADEADRLSSEALSTLDALGTFDRTKDVCFERYQIVALTQGEHAARPYLERAHQLLLEQAAKVGDPELRESFLNEFRINSSILLAHRLGRPPTPLLYRRVRLPHSHAPTGRPLREDEYVEVIWTISAPEDNRIIEETHSERHRRITRRRHSVLRLLREAAERSAAPTLDDLAKALDVSISTIKRDLTALRKIGHEVRSRGSRDHSERRAE